MRVYQGWKIVAAGFVIATVAWVVGFYGPSVYLVALSQRHGWSVSQISTTITAYYIASAILTSFAGDLYQRFHPAALITIAMLALGGGLVLLGIIDQLWQLYPVFGLIVLGWSLTGGAAVYAIVGPWFDRRRGLALSIALTGASFAGVITVPIWTALLPHYGFSGTSRLVALGCAIVLIPIAWAFLRRIPSGGLPTLERREAAGEGSPATPGMVPTRRSLLRMPYFWTIAGPFALGLFVQVGLLTHQLAFLSPTLGPTDAAFCVAVTGAMAIIGRLLVGSVVDRLDVRIASALVLVIQAIGLLTLWQTSSFSGLLIGCVLFGFGVGNLITLPSLIVHREFDDAAFTRVVGLIIAINQLVFAFGPGFLGYVRTITGSYGPALVVCAVIQLICAAVVLLRPPVTPPSR
jgi:predicted MFS family arabinose efflux permease